MRHLGIDYGSKRVGIALSDEGGRMGFPHGILENTPKLIKDMLELIAREHVGAVVIGESHNLDGSENPIARAAHAFGDAIFAHTGLPVFYESEVFTSEEARQAPHKIEKTRAPKERTLVDDSAAALILNGYLSRNHSENDHGQTPHFNK